MSNEKYSITSRSVLGALANWAVQQSPYHRPENLEVVLDKFYELTKTELNDSMKQYIKSFDSLNECRDWIKSKLDQIPEYRLWNERKNGRQGNGFSAAGHHDNGDVTLYNPKADDDFIDLDALVRNVANMAIRD